MTSGATGQTAPSQVVGLAASPASSSSVQLNWSTQAVSAPATSFTVYYGVTGSSNWTSSVTAGSGNGTVITGLQAATSYELRSHRIKRLRTGPRWNAGSLPVGDFHSLESSPERDLYTCKRDDRPRCARVALILASPGRFLAFSLYSTLESWTAANLVDSDPWGAYVPTPASAGDWYV
jgi:Fibronectin type III domain